MGHVISGVTVNGTEIRTVVGGRALAFELDEDGSVKPAPPSVVSPLGGA